MTPTTTYNSWLHRFAVLTACVSLLPIVVGALVTTKDAGMAFRDWPSSDGHSMFLYPWFAAAGDKFIEHGHRLAGALVGLFSIALAAIAWRSPARRSVRVLALLILAAVILQGVIGGLRVLADQRLLAMVHGSFAALVFCLMAALALVTSRSWNSVAGSETGRISAGLKPLAVVTPIVLFIQYLAGGMLRHLGTALHEHIGLAVVVSLFVTITSIVALLNGSSWLYKPALWLLAALCLQLLLGIGAWVTRFGLASLGYVAVHQAPVQVVFRTAHTVAGMLLLMAAVLFTLRVFRLDARRQETSDARFDADTLRHAVPSGGGVG